ncbi:hypothetical protein OQJ46_16580, partial [Microbulbifer thermotolerans]|uniref:hypothetical protein n=1 Tax=Microbulbifer thermotolerans TaxID=252514 RepID=UPI00224AEB23
MPNRKYNYKFVGRKFISGTGESSTEWFWQFAGYAGRVLKKKWILIGKKNIFFMDWGGAGESRNKVSLVSSNKCNFLCSEQIVSP